jgi:hypothetical protein
MNLYLKLAILIAVFATVAITDGPPAEAQTIGSAPGCAYTYEPPGGPWTNYVTDETYRYVDLHRADGTVDRIQPAPAGTVLPGTAVRMVKCYPATPEVPTPTPTPVPTPTPEAPDPEPEPEPAPNVAVEVLRCNDTDRPNTEAYAVADGPGWYVDGTVTAVLEPGVPTLVAWNSYATLIHGPTGETISIEALGSDLCVPQTTVPEPVCQEDDPCWDCETMGNRICGPNNEPPVFPLPTPDTTPDSGSPVPPYGDTSSVPPTAAEPVPGEDVLAFTGPGQLTVVLVTAGLLALVAGVLLSGTARRIGERIARHRR